MGKRNYQKELDALLDGLRGEKPTLLLHSCCAPCSSYCMEYLRRYFRITAFYYNPNITAREEYEKRAAEERRLIDAYNAQTDAERIEYIDGDYEPTLFFDTVRGLEECREGGERCFLCYALRLEKTAALAKKEGFAYFCTTLTISPLKNADKLNEIGARLGEAYGVPFLPSDFKKRGGYQRSIELSEIYGLYRQDYCGCVFSRRKG